MMNVKNLNINKDMVLKLAGYTCSLAGAVIGLVVTDKENTKKIEKAVADHLMNK